MPLWFFLSKKQYKEQQPLCRFTESSEHFRKQARMWALKTSQGSTTQLITWHQIIKPISCVIVQKPKSNSEITIIHLNLILTNTSLIQPIQMLQELKLLTIKWGKQSFRQTEHSLHFHQQPDGVHLLLLEIYSAAVEWVDSQCKSHGKAIKKEFT